MPMIRSFTVAAARSAPLACAILAAPLLALAGDAPAAAPAPPAASEANPALSAPAVQADAEAPQMPGRTLGGRVITGEAARWTQEGSRQIKERHFAEALGAFKHAADLDSNHPVVWNNLGTAYLTVDKPMKAESAFRRAIKLDPNYAMAHYNLGAVRDARLDYDGAIASYARAFELDPLLADPKNNPAVVNNTHLAAVNLILYQRQLGALGTGITPVKHADDEPPPE